MEKNIGFEFVTANEVLKVLEEFGEEPILKLPKRSTAKSAGYDCFSPISFSLKSGESIKLPTLIKAYMPANCVLEVYPRSGLGFKHFLRLANTVGIIDADYYNNPDNEGHIFVKLRNEGDKELHVKKGDAICQFIFKEYLLIDGDDFTGNERVGGMGSTDKEK